ncbi:YhgN family NAAT transporter [Buchnera aphidicola (Aphis nasturtii)]|uniref:YhgN family NAAT transporter n=1 Tax=Buchnera aphidicola TaxID=9 RepID=UPI0010C53BF9|nr:YhgN family NAAT transporter [Buchnera aphidicola]QCI18408.1 YhgN family NAAT transporter [Buchnera aphidicola (Aphis nasturtii)]
MTEIISTTILLILIMDPLGNLPVFMTILKNLNAKRRRIVVIREMIIALIFMLLFLFAGEKILNILNLKTETVSISGGIILFLIAIKMIFPSEENNGISSNEEPFLVPLAIPLVAGPSLLATLMLLSHQYLHHISYLVGSLLIAWCFTIIVLLLSGFFLKLFGSKGVNALERLMGLILIMLATQMFLDGVRTWFQN